MQSRKKIYPGLSAVAASLLLGAAAMPASAAPLYYSFQGQVVYSNASEYALGQSVSYVFLVDWSIDGHRLDGDGNLQTIGDFSETQDFFRLSFYAAYVGGDAFTSDNPLSPIRESCYCGIDQVRYDEVFSALRGSNGDLGGFDNLDIWSYETRFSDWAVGQNLLAENFVANGPGESNTSYSSSMVLAAITEENPLPAAVPEPSLPALFGLGLLGLFLVSKSRQARKRRRP